MKRFLTRKEFKVKRKEMIYMVIGIAVILSLYFIFTREKKPVAETPIVSVMPASQQNVQIFGEYVGRIRAQQFVEVRARVEGFLEQMLFEEGTSVKRNQVLFVINQDQYRAKADKVRAQLKKDQAQAQKAKRVFLSPKLPIFPLPYASLRPKEHCGTTQQFFHHHNCRHHLS